MDINWFLEKTEEEQIDSIIILIRGFGRPVTNAAILWEIVKVKPELVDRVNKMFDDVK